MPLMSLKKLKYAASIAYFSLRHNALCCTITNKEMENSGGKKSKLCFGKQNFGVKKGDKYCGGKSSTTLHKLCCFDSYNINI